MAEDKDVHKGHRERMLKRFSKGGIGNFQDHEKLEVLLYQIIPRINTNVIAHNLINYFGSLKSVLLAPADELVKVKGIGDKSALQLKFIGELVGYLNDAKVAVKREFDNITDIISFCQNHFKDKTHEVLTLFLLDEKCVLLNICDLSSNMPNLVNVEFRQIARQALNYDARKLVIAHNHVTGTTEPSNKDLKFTRELSYFLKDIKIELIDHIIICNNAALSMRKSGYLSHIWEV